MIQGLFVAGALFFLFLFYKSIKFIKPCDVNGNHNWISNQRQLIEVDKCEYCGKAKARFID